MPFEVTTKTMLNKPPDWHRWIDQIKQKAQGTQVDVWPYINPDKIEEAAAYAAANKADPGRLIALQGEAMPDEPVEPTFPVLPISGEIDWNVQKYKQHQYDIALRKWNRACDQIESVRKLFQETVPTKHSIIYKDKKSLFSKIVALKKALAPTQLQRKMELKARYALLTRYTPRNCKVEVHVEKWRELYQEALEINLSETQDHQISLDFLMSIENYDTKHVSTALYELQKAMAADKDIPQFLDILELYLNYRRLHSIRDSSYHAHAATLGDSGSGEGDGGKEGGNGGGNGGKGGNKKDKGKDGGNKKGGKRGTSKDCPCGLSHKGGLEACFYLNPNVRPETWVLADHHLEKINQKLAKDSVLRRKVLDVGYDRYVEPREDQGSGDEEVERIEGGGRQGGRGNHSATYTRIERPLPPRKVEPPKVSSPTYTWIETPLPPSEVDSHQPLPTPKIDSHQKLMNRLKNIANSKTTMSTMMPKGHREEVSDPGHFSLRKVGSLIKSTIRRLATKLPKRRSRDEILTDKAMNHFRKHGDRFHHAAPATCSTTQNSLFSKWVTDSGSDVHVINHVKYHHFTKTADGAPEDYVTAGDTHLPILEWGTVQIPCTLASGKKAVMELKDVAYVPNFMTSLICLDLLQSSQVHWSTRNPDYLESDRTKRRYQLHQDGKHWCITEHSSATSSKRNAVYDDCNINSEFSTFAATSKKPLKATHNARQMHAILAHAGPDAILHVNEACADVHVTHPDKCPARHECDVCGTTKSTQKISRRSDVDYLEDGEAFDRLSYDLIPMKRSLNGHNWVGHLQCRTHKFHMVRTFPRKSDALEALIEMLAEIKTIHKGHTRFIRMDNERSIIEKLSAWCKTQGIILERVAPYVKEPNFSERAGRLLTAKARAMRTQANLPAYLWGEIYAAAAYIANRTPVKALGWKTPFEAVTGRKPRVAHMRVYGIKAYVHIPTELIKKTEERLFPNALIGYLIGWDSTNKFRIWLPSTRQVVSKRDVTFGTTFYNTRTIDPMDLAIIEPEEIVEINAVEEEETPKSYESHFDIGDYDFEENEISEDADDVPLTFYEHSVIGGDPNAESGGDIDQTRGHDNSDNFGEVPKDVPTPPDDQDYDNPLEQDEVPELSAEDRARYAYVEDADEDMYDFEETRDFDNTGEVHPNFRTSEDEDYEVIDSIHELREAHGRKRRQNRHPDQDVLDDDTLPDPHIQEPKRRRLHRSGRTYASHATHKERIDLNDPISSYVYAFAAAHEISKTCELTLVADLPAEPKTWAAMLRHPRRKHFMLAAEKEWKALMDKATFRYVKYDPNNPDHKRLLPLKWIFKYKPDADGYLEKEKARLVGRGDLQYTLSETYAATLATETFRVMLAIMTYFDLDAAQYDCTAAYLNAILKAKLYGRCPEGHEKEGHVIEIDKALYGLKESAYLWSQMFTEKLEELGLSPIPGVNCVYSNDWLYVVFYVDDIYCLYHPKDKERYQAFEKQLMGAFDMTYKGPGEFFLGTRITRDRATRQTWITHDAYIEKMAKKFHIPLEGKHAKTPLPTKELVPNTEQATAEQIHEYAMKVGSINWPTISCRPDVAFPLSRLSTFMTNPSRAHLDAADHCLDYLVGTRFHGIRYQGEQATPYVHMGTTPGRRTNHNVPSDSHDFKVFSDAAFADNWNRWSSWGFAMILFGGVTMYKAIKQKTVTVATTETELLAISATAREMIYWLRFFDELKLKFSDDTVIRCDNMQTIRLLEIETPKLVTKLKHVDVHQCWLREQVQRKRIKVEYVPTADMAADGFTKKLHGQSFEHWKQMIGLVDASEAISKAKASKI